jgi:hypothetical protein
LFNQSVEKSAFALIQADLSSFNTLLAYSSNIGKTGKIVTCLGDNQSGNTHAKCSINTHIPLSKLHEIAL